MYFVGHLDGDELPIQAAERETKEEAGFDCQDLEYNNKFQEKITYDVKGSMKIVYYYLARLKNIQQQVILSNEHQNSSWSNLDDACELVKYAEMQQVLRKADEFIRDNQMF
jgi:bis(5'-nucleosidyl)-tetraphosphatase